MVVLEFDEYLLVKGRFTRLGLSLLGPCTSSGDGALWELLSGKRNQTMKYFQPRSKMTWAQVKVLNDLLWDSREL